MKHTNVIGIDISESSIKVLQLDAQSNIVAYGSDFLPDGVVKGGLIIDIEAFAKKVNGILEQAKPYALSNKDVFLPAALSLPESKLLTLSVKIPDAVKKADVKEYVREAAEKVMPFNLDDMYWDYHLVVSGAERRATFVGAQKTHINNYVTACTSARIRPALIGGELSSLGVALLERGTLKAPTMVLDIGAHSTTIGIFDVDTTASLSVMVRVGGDDLTNALVTKLEITPEEAERHKREGGLTRKRANMRVAATLREAMKEIIDNIIEEKKYFEQQSGRAVTRVILAGGVSLMPDLATYITESIGEGVEVGVANPLAYIKNSEALDTHTPAIFFANVIGLALTGVDIRTAGINLLTQYRYDDDSSGKKRLGLTGIRSLKDARHVLSGTARLFLESIQSSLQFFGHHVRTEAKLVLTILVLGGALAGLATVLVLYL